MKVYNKFVESKKEPLNKNDIWFDGEVFNIYKEGKWQAFTFRVSDAEAVIRIVREFVAYYNNDIKPTVQEAQEAAARIETYVSLAIEATETSTRNNELFVKLNTQLAELFSELQSLIDASNTAISSAQEAASLASSQAKLAQQATQETLEATVNANNAINTINTLVETLEETINNKVDKIPGKGLSTNDYTTSEKDKLASLENYNDSEIKSQLTELSNKVDNLPQKEGNYPLLHVGTADDLAGRGESVPASFGFRASGGKSIKDGRAYIKRIKGNSVVWNQVYPTGWSFTREGITITSQNNIITANGTLTTTYFGNAPIVENEVNHKYLFTVEGLSSALNGANFSLQNRWGSEAIISNGFAYFFHDNSDPSLGCNIGFSRLTSGAVISETYILRQIDLTKMFGAGYEPTTIEEFNARVATLGVDMNAYNEGQVIHCNTESIKSVGDNAWDEEWEVGAFYSHGGFYDNTTAIRAKNFIKVLPNTEYYINRGSDTAGFLFAYDKDFQQISGWNIYGNNKSFTTPVNAEYIKFCTGSSYGPIYKNDIMITLVHSGWKQDTDAGYQPYWQDTLPLPIIRKYFPDGMKSAGSAHDEIYYDKMQNKKFAVQRIKAVKMKDLNVKLSTNSLFYVSLADMKLPTTDAERLTGILSNRYDISANAGTSGMGDKTMLRFPTGTLYIKDLSYTDASSLKASFNDEDILYYELAEPIITELDAEDQNFRDYYNVADFGTEEAIPATDAEGNIIPSAPFSADIIYQFNAVDMIREHELEITELQNIIATMQAQLASLTSNF